eukprot:766547-Hanusia_phi.AAC.3
MDPKFTEVDWGAGGDRGSQGGGWGRPPLHVMGMTGDSCTVLTDSITPPPRGTVFPSDQEGWMYHLSTG